jgi:hypothetical protein
MPKPTTSAQSYCTEAACAAALASHSAASLAAAAGFREAARLLRASEALARAATAALPAPSHLDVGGPGAGDGATVHDAQLKKRRSRKKKVKPSATVDVNEGAEVPPPADGVPEATLVAPALAMSPDAVVFVPSTAARVLAKHSSRERSPRGIRSVPAPASPSPTTSGVTSPLSIGTGTFTKGMAVVLVDLVSRPDLAGMSGVVKAFDPTSLRHTVIVDATGESVRALGKNIKASIFAPGAGFG